MAGGDTNIFAKYKIPENFFEIDVSDANGKKTGVKIRTTGSKSLYGNGGIRAERAGYTTLQPVEYKTQVPVGSFYLPLPDSFYIASDYSWSDKSEEGLAEFMSRIGQERAAGRDLDLKTAFDAAAMGAGRSWINKVRTAFAGKEFAKINVDGAVDAFLRGAGVAYNPNKQLYFEGPSFSTAVWNFKFAPKSASEAAIIYNTAKCIFILTAPGAAGDNTFTLLNRLKDDVLNIFRTQSPEEEKQRNEKATKDALDEMQAKLGTFGYISSAQPAFFTYPVLWDVGFHVPTNYGAKPVFEWKRLAVTSIKLNFGSNMKWHADGYPVQMDMDFNVQETIIRHAANMPLVMPTLIN